MFNLGAEYNYTPTYDEMYNDYKSGAINKDQLKDLARQRRELDYKQADNQFVKDSIGNGARAAIGGALEGASFAPVFNIPYVGTGLGGALYEWGNSINNKESALDTLKNMGKGFAIGETIGAVPYVGKLAGKTKAGAKFGDMANKAYQRIADTSIGSKIGQGLNNASDFLMQEFAPLKNLDRRLNKQIVYHGSPYDFGEFTDSAIGTGEGAQAHGLGHYAAKNKDVADENYRLALAKNNYDPESLNGLSDNAKELVKLYDRNYAIRDIQDNINYTKNWIKEQKAAGKLTPESEQANVAYLNQKLNDLKQLRKLPHKDAGQLYQVAVPKDDVLLREGALYKDQPKKVLDAYNAIRQKYFNLKPISANKSELLNYFANNIDMHFASDRRVFETVKNIVNGDRDKITITDMQNLYDYFHLKPDVLSMLDGYMKDGDELLRKLYSKFYGNGMQPNARDIARKKTYQTLKDNGIKGISYNGAQEGESVVIFDPKDMDIVKKYYNQPKLWEYLNGKSPNAGAAVNSLFNYIQNP